jgi:GNAT superfamily N-acetyltransferase
MDSLNLSIVTGDDKTELATWIREKLNSFNEKFLGPVRPSHFAAVAKVGDEVVGGMVGVAVLDWLSIEAVFLDEKFRGRGLGAAMLLTLEEEAKRLGATRAFVDTTSFQAEGFYAKFGYKEWGRFREFAPGVDRIYMRKDSL